jgi:hypothetical protein
MKKLFPAFVLIILSFSAIAQSDKVDDRLLIKYSVEELNALKTETPSEYNYINYCLDNAWYIQALPKEKMKNNDGRIGKIQIQDINNINFYSLNVNIIKDDYQFFAIEGTNKMLVIKSKDHILKELNK